MSLVRQEEDSELLIKREKFAVNLRKQKRTNIINQSRLKYDIHPNCFKIQNDADTVDEYCLAV